MIDDVVLRLGVAMVQMAGRWRDAVGRLGPEQRGAVDDAPSRMIWLAVSVAVAVAATAFALTVFGQARDAVPDPIPPVVP